MLSAIFGGIGGSVVNGIVNSILGPFTHLFEAYLKKEISIEELRSRMVIALLGAVAEVEVSHSETLAKTYASFMQAATQSLLLRVVWASVAVSQLLVLLWHQVGIPAVIALGWLTKYPSSGSTVEWAYALVGACVGFGPLVLRTGPGSISADKLKSLLSK